MMKAEKDVSKRDLILNVTLKLMKKEGFDGVTVRKIASLAKVNVASINYHFGSKDKLLNEAIQILLNSLRESFAILDDASITPRERLKYFLIEYLKTNQQYPFIIRRLVMQEPAMFESQINFMNFIKVIGLKKVQKTIQELSGEQDSQILTVMMTHIMGALFLPTLIEPLYELVTDFSFPDVETRVEILLDRYFGYQNDL
ncbi:TetR/AcrR family transcriptional regulator [Bacillus sp. B15-48]|uniref:TetR/AcrR family transcriptional regulator n=1 Tax=Bacillus sp. B15-48 TaxID=1548601 RepID=UPI00193EE7CE|nr:TetR/AcrR family transcriptional regulator [Bacillus sp. B15-48]MBM4762890.1 TetR family transcriptional regulator [Bacillus sp. B15-48]